VAHTRAFRRREYFRAIAAGPDGSEIASIESQDDLDQVLYHPRRLACLLPPDVDAGVNLEPVKAAVRERLDRSGKTEVQERRGGGNEDLALDTLWIFEWSDPASPNDAPSAVSPFARAGEDRNDSLQFAKELNETFPQQVAPIYYTVTQQGVQPGEDPEAGQPPLGIGPDAVTAAADPGALGHGIVIAVIDTGVDDDAVTKAPLPHQHFEVPADVDVLSVAGAGAAPGLLGPAAGHGTFIASLIHCVAPGAEVHSFKVAGPLGTANEEDIADGIRRALAAGAQVINLSLGGYPFVENSMWPTLPAFPVLQRAIESIPDHVAVVAAAGNCGSGAEFFPAAFPRVVGVAALDDCANRLWEHSNFGPWVKACTRGVNLCGLFVKGDEDPAYDPDGMAESWGDPVNYATWTGTSFAAPLVAAQIAILAAELAATHTPQQAAEALLGMSKHHPDQKPCGKRVLVDLPGQT